MINRKLKRQWSLPWLTAILFSVSNLAFAHSGPLNKLALAACNEKLRSQACQYEGVHDDLYIGKCQYMSTALMCVRNQPIQKIINEQSESEATHNHN